MAHDERTPAEQATVASRRAPPPVAATETREGSSSPSGGVGVKLDLERFVELEAEASRYKVRRVLGRGGMGEVHLAEDARIGRSVALKVMRGDDGAMADAHARFLREARVQGQLEHPAIVPVYDLGRDAEGQVFFVMKRVGGLGLDAVLKGLRAGDEDICQRFSMRRLLSALQQVCLALDYAHTRGVVHRDIKPSNLMLGDFGEVYLLDWGIAKVIGVEDSETTAVVGDLTPGLDTTRHGDVLGSLGYMAPEQLAASSEVGPQADVYSLGSVLFQLLTLEALHPGRTPQARALSTTEGVDARASLRAPQRKIPPELDAICVRATATKLADRYPSARALHDDIEAFLAGDRDLRLRAELAAKHTDAARAAAERLKQRGPRSVADRKEALHEAGRAIALAPESTEAAEILARLMLEPPAELPPEVLAESERLEREESQRGALFGAFALLTFIPAAFGMTILGLRSWLGVALISVPLLIGAAHGFYISLRDPEHFRLHAFILAFPICTAIAASTGFAGPIFVTPVFTLAFISIISALNGLGRWRIGIIALAMVSFVIPGVLEALGVTPQTYFAAGDALAIKSHYADLTSPRLRPALVATYLSTFLVVAVVLYRLTMNLRAARLQLQLQAWQMSYIASRRSDETKTTADAPPDAPGAPGETPPEPPTITSLTSR